MLVFIFPGKHVEINPANQLVPAEDVIDGDIRVPYLGVRHRLVADAIHLAGQVEDSLQYPRIFKIGSYSLRIVAELVDLGLPLQIAVVPQVDAVGFRIMTFLVSQQLIVIVLRTRLGGGRDLLNEIGGILFGGHHFVFGDVGSPVRVTQQVCQVVTFLQHVS